MHMLFLWLYARFHKMKPMLCLLLKRYVLPCSFQSIEFCTILCSHIFLFLQENLQSMHGLNLDVYPISFAPFLYLGIKWECMCACRGWVLQLSQSFVPYVACFQIRRSKNVTVRKFEFLKRHGLKCSIKTSMFCLFLRKSQFANNIFKMNSTNVYSSSRPHMLWHALWQHCVKLH